MTAILTAAEMRAVEEDAFASALRITPLTLMERAGAGVVQAILAEWPQAAAAPQRALVLCGPGNNGGDGFVVARLLRERGWEAAVWFRGEADRLSEAARASHDAWLAAGGTIRSIPEKPLRGSAREPRPWREGLGPHDFVIDALFGIGLTRPIDPDSAFDVLLHAAFDEEHESEEQGARNHRVAVDVPSGLCADSGRVLSPLGPANDRPIFRADLTVTFHAAKSGHYLAEGPNFCGKVVVASLGALGHAGSGRRFRGPSIRLLDEREALPERRIEYQPGMRSLAKRAGHKYAHGHALLLSGGCGRGGAARLAARGALRIGAGLVTLAVPPAALQENAARLDAIMLRSVRDAGALAGLLADPRYDALAAGPGLGTGEREAALLAALLAASRGEGEAAEALAPGLAGPDPAGTRRAAPEAAGAAAPGPRSSRAVVLDADALTLLARDPALRAKLHAACVLTPHEGEFARLFPAIAERWRAPATTGPAYSKLDAARDAAREAGCVILLKGPDTVIAEPGGRAAINAAVYDRAAPWLATAGSGDVLAGFVAGLLARGFAPFEAACAAAWLHVECARSFGPGLIAEDLADELPKVFRGLGL